jgi:hypothetical protein
MKPTKLVVFLLFLLGVALCLPHAAAAKNGVLQIEMKRRTGVLEIAAVLGSERQTVRLDDAKGALSRRLNGLNAMLESWQKHSPGDFTREFEALGTLFYGPVREFIDRAETIVLYISPDMIRFPFEHLHHQGKPLALQKPIIVQFEALAPRDFSWRNIGSALLIADLTADPDEAVARAAKRFQWGDYHDLDEEGNPSFLKKLPRRDLLLVSAHGEISFGVDDCIEFDDKSYAPETWARVAPELAYFDSCQVGVSQAFLKAFQEAGTRYFVAPVTSNEAGNSSSRTIKAFFDALKAGESPARSLFLTKGTLYEHFSRKGKISYGELLYKALPFRVYRLN